MYESSEPKDSLHDCLTEVEEKIVDNAIKELDTNDAKALEVCKTRLALAEQEIISLDTQLKEALHQLQLNDEASCNMMRHKKKIDSRNKLEISALSLPPDRDLDSRRRLSLFSSSDSLSLCEKDTSDHDRSICFKLDFCRML